MGETTSGMHLGRRGFGAGVLAVAATVALTPMKAAASWSGSVTPFAIDYGENVRVAVSSGERFSVIVTDLDGSLIEQHHHLTSSDLLDLRSANFRARPIAVPA